MKTIKIITLLLLLSFIGYILYYAISVSNQVTEQTVKLHLRDISRNIVVSGTIIPSKEIEIKSNISGVLDELYVKVGQYINKGQAIARVRVETNPAEYRQLQKRVEVIETQFRQRRHNYSTYHSAGCINIQGICGGS
jgi:HlyD family secretion protein